MPTRVPIDGFRQNRKYKYAAYIVGPNRDFSSIESGSLQIHPLQIRVGLRNQNGLKGPILCKFRAASKSRWRNSPAVPEEIRD